MNISMNDSAPKKTTLGIAQETSTPFEVVASPTLAETRAAAAIAMAADSAPGMDRSRELIPNQPAGTKMVQGKPPIVFGPRARVDPR
jgi:hypothetical protein